MSEPLPRCRSFRIARRQGCARSLNWTLVWREPIPKADRLILSLLNQGFQARPTVAGIFHGEDPRTNEQILVVLRNTRTELRLPYTIPANQRSRSAVSLAHRIAQTAASLSL